MTTNVHWRPVRPPPNTWSETTPKSSGASAWASERSTVRIASARPQSCDGMMSSRAASSGGFWAESANAASAQVGEGAERAAGEQRRHEQHGRAGRSDDADEDAALQIAPAHERVAEEPAGEHAEHGADADEQQEQVRERLVDPVLLLRELGAERLDAGEEVVAAARWRRSGRGSSARAGRDARGREARCSAPSREDELPGPARCRARARAAARRSRPSARRSAPAAHGWRRRRAAADAVPPRGGSGSRSTSHASAKAGTARITNAARQESVAMSPVTANPKPAPSSSPARMKP